MLRVFCSIGFQTSRNVIKVKKTSAFSSKEIADIVRALGKENEDGSKTLFVGVKTNGTKWWLEEVSKIGTKYGTARVRLSRIAEDSLGLSR